MIPLLPFKPSELKDARRYVRLARTKVSRSAREPSAIHEVHIFSPTYLLVYYQPELNTSERISFSVDLYSKTFRELDTTVIDYFKRAGGQTLTQLDNFLQRYGW